MTTLTETIVELRRLRNEDFFIFAIAARKHLPALCDAAAEAEALRARVKELEEQLLFHREGN